MWKRMALAYFKHFSGGTDENHENQSASLLMSQKYLILTNAK
jgi:hypothetical protein